MTAKYKSVLAFLVVASLLLCPIGRCTQTVWPSSTPPPCHQKDDPPVREDCGTSGCVYMKPLSIEVITTTDDASMRMALPAVPHAVAKITVPNHLAAVRSSILVVQRPLSLHQLLI